MKNTNSDCVDDDCGAAAEVEVRREATLWAVGPGVVGSEPVAECWMHRQKHCKTTAQDWDWRCSSNSRRIRLGLATKRKPMNENGWPVVAGQQTPMSTGPRNSFRIGVWFEPNRNGRASCWLASPELPFH